MKKHFSDNLENFETIAYYDGPIVYSGFYNGKKYFFCAHEESYFVKDAIGLWTETIYWESGTENYMILHDENYNDDEKRFVTEKRYFPDDEELKIFRKIQDGKFWDRDEE